MRFSLQFHTTTSNPSLAYFLRPWLCVIAVTVIQGSFFPRCSLSFDQKLIPLGEMRIHLPAGQYRVVFDFMIDWRYEKNATRALRYDLFALLRPIRVRFRIATRIFNFLEPPSSLGSNTRQVGCAGFWHASFTVPAWRLCFRTCICFAAPLLSWRRSFFAVLHFLFILTSPFVLA